MISKTATEVIKNAEFLGNIKNSNMLNFSIATTLLNSLYRTVYNDIIDNSDAYVKYFDFTDHECALPSDCYQVASVYRVGSNGSLPIQLNPAGKDNFIAGEYNIQNNVITIYGYGTGTNTFRIKYVPYPITITAPNDMVSVYSGTTDYTVNSFDDKYIYYTMGGTLYQYSIDEQTTVTGATLPTVIKGLLKDYYQGQTITFTADSTYNCGYKILWGTEDVSDYFKAEDLYTGTNITISNWYISGPYIAIQYSNNDIYLMSNWDKVVWNPLASTGHSTKGVLKGLYTNDVTGDGLLVQLTSDDNYTATPNLYLASFVPDTVLSYPDQVFFDIIEVKLAALLESMTGMTNSYLNETYYQQVEKAYYNTLSKMQKPYRVNNYKSSYYYF